MIERAEARRPLRLFLHCSRRGPLRRVEWWFQIVAPNGRILAHSEGYQRRIDAQSAATLIVRGPIELVEHDR